MPSFDFGGKLVRHKIPQRMRENGTRVDTTTVRGERLEHALDEKFDEESDELRKARTREKKLGEIVDVMQALYDMAKVQCGVGEEELDELRQAKEREFGGFSAGVCVEVVTMTDEDPYVEHCRNNPDRYPEVGQV